ncbi:hypothetical protein [Desulforhopalus singaporensis]|uniref:Outer membrane protein beta-barrel domain-containing protein n=1 Tax=Desulforhopalus singaporensis TaxID=91360 RepID=A0A1H0NDF2_9BACT|nr:hypothetical protein [Desulforhopalus singaporensis]SDO90566.1 hypothetical protein SAMN05660330_01351 [Desulforhopalus singaporensis]
MKKAILAALLMTIFFFPPTGFGAEHRLGGGTNYWVTLDDITDSDDNGIDDDGFSFIASYQYRAGLLGFEADLELLPDRFGETAIAPQAYILLGKAIYVAAGIGVVYSDDEFADEPFFGLRGGFDMEILPGIYADIYANYRFNDRASLDNEDTDIDTDTVFLGAMVRLSL